METTNIYETDDEVKALALQEALESAGIAAVLVNHRDTAYPGITDRLRHGTEIRVEADQVADATRIIEEFGTHEGGPRPGMARYHADFIGFIGSCSLFTK